MKKILILLGTLSISLAFASTLFLEKLKCPIDVILGSTIFFRKLKCPIDGKEFEFCGQGSGTSFGQMLDMRPYGPIISPNVHKTASSSIRSFLPKRLPP